MDPEQFSAYMRTETNPSTSEETPQKEAYRYSKVSILCNISWLGAHLLYYCQSNRFVMRSQLDCHDPRLPGTGVFDLKTRACLPIRMDLLNFEVRSLFLFLFLLSNSMLGKFWLPYSISIRRDGKF